MKLLRLGLVLFTVYVILNRLLYTWLPSNYIFDPKVLNTICNSVIDKHGEISTEEESRALFQDLRTALANTYGEQYINELKDDEWIFNNAGGAMGNMIILHASVTEYLIIFGTAVGNEGHSGVHFADDYFTILVGQQTAALPHGLRPEVYTAGMTHHLQKGYVKQYSMTSGSYALELAQGYIPAMLPFGFLDTFSSTLDFYTLYRTVYLTGRDMLKNLFINRKL